MKVFLRVAVDVYSQIPGKKFDSDRVRDEVQDSIYEALQGWRPAPILDGQVALLFDYAEVTDSDLHDEF